ncbi:MAG: iron-siderophore ABC transporter substrate-binding protein, partial [Firmicutes bacterium]|nr:iron-siderophore ABC transporter substrate-binding protein [Bacillota bacterium]
ENADQLDDIEMMVVYGDENLVETLQEDKLMSQIPAIKNGAVVVLDSTSALAASSTPSILSIPYEIDDYLEMFAKAAENIK